MDRHDYYKIYRENNIEQIKFKQKERYNRLGRTKQKQKLIERMLKKNEERVLKYRNS